MKFLPHQVDKADKVLALLRKVFVVYIQGKPRSGKTATALKVAEDSKIDSWLVLCPKNAISGWLKFIEDEELNLQTKFTVINYEQVYKRYKVGHKTKYKLRHNPEDFGGTILDEGHNYGKLGKPSIRAKMTKQMCNNNPLIVLSGTAIVESPCGIFHQLFISKFSPFKFKNFYDFHRRWGKPYSIPLGGREIQQYDKYKPELLDEIDKLTIYMTQEDAGISSDMQAIDKVHYIELEDNTKALYNKLVKTKSAKVWEGMLCGEPEPTKPYKLILDSVMKERTTLHQLESGVLKVEDVTIVDGEPVIKPVYLLLGNTEKIDYIKKEFGDEEGTGIMRHFIGEGYLLSDTFTQASVYSSTSSAEGVDLSNLYNFVILSSDYRGSKFIQRRERIININGSNSRTVNHILVKGGVSEQVYKKVSKKQDFNNECYERGLL